jgi:hypothetical protein
VFGFDFGAQLFSFGKQLKRGGHTRPGIPTIDEVAGWIGD